MLEKTKDIANRIRALREDLGETKKQVAEKIAISLDLYSVYESGREDIPASVLAKIAAAFRIDIGLLLTGETPKMSQFEVRPASRPEFRHLKENNPTRERGGGVKFWRA